MRNTIAAPWTHQYSYLPYKEHQQLRSFPGQIGRVLPQWTSSLGYKRGTLISGMEATVICSNQMLHLRHTVRTSLGYSSMILYCLTLWGSRSWHPGTSLTLITFFRFSSFRSSLNQAGWASLKKKSKSGDPVSSGITRISLLLIFWFIYALLAS